MFLSSAITLLLLGTAIRVAMRLVYGARGPAVGDPMYLLMSVTSWVFLVLGSIAMSLVFASVFGVLLWIIAIVVVLMVIGRNQEMRRRALISVLAVSAERRLPLGETLKVFSGESRHGISDNARRIAATLDDGATLPAALDMHRRKLPELAPVFAHVGAATGAMGAALREAARGLSPGDWLWHTLMSRTFYLLAVASIGLSVWTFTCIKIVPAYEKIFDDFEMELPEATKAMIAVSNIVANYFPLVLAPLLLVVVVMLVLWFFQALGWVSQSPLVDRVAKRVHTAAVLRALVLAIEQDRPLVEVLDVLAHNYPRRSVRKRLRYVAAEVDLGHDWIESLRRNKLIGASDEAILQAAARVGNLAWALRTVADAGVRRLSYRVQLAGQILFPIVVLAIGAGVFLFAVGLVLPLAKMIMDLT